MGLFKPAWQSNDYYKASSFVEKTTDQNLLAEIAQTAPDFEIRLLAAEKLTNQVLAQKIYFDTVQNNKTSYTICKMAMEKITDQTFLKKIATNFNEDILVCDIAADMLEDKTVAETVFARVAVSFGDGDDEACHTTSVIAFRKLTNQELIFRVAEQAKSSYVVRDAVYELNEKEYLTRIANSNLAGRYRFSETINGYTHVEDLREIAQKKLNELQG